MQKQIKDAKKEAEKVSSQAGELSILVNRECGCDRGAQVAGHVSPRITQQMRGIFPWGTGEEGVR